MVNDLEPIQAGAAADPRWVDEQLLRGGDDEVCLVFDEPVSRGQLRDRVTARAAELSAAGLRPGGAVSLWLPPGEAYVLSLLAAWRIGAQVSLLDHRLTSHEADQALARIAPQFVVSAAPAAPAAPGDPGSQSGPQGPAQRPGLSKLPLAYSSVRPVIAPFAGQPAATGHVLLQLSSGSTGTSKIIARTAPSLIAELDRYRRIDGTPRRGERVVLLASMVHVLGLVGGLLYCLNAGVELAFPRTLSPGALIAAVMAATVPATVLGVPSHLALLLAADPSARLPRLSRITVGGELVSPKVRRSLAERYGVPLGVMYGMTEAGVIATDLSGAHYPALAPAPGMVLREEAGQLLLAMPESPYLGTVRAGSWADGWLHTGDAGTVDSQTGSVTVLGRRDSQVSVGGLKVDLTEVEETLAALPGVTDAIVVFDGAIEAFVMLGDPAAGARLRGDLGTLLAAYKLPRRVHVVADLPRTSSGKRVRNLDRLRAAAARDRADATKESTADVR